MSLPEKKTLLSGPSLGYVTFRLTLGVNFLMHGLVRVLGDWSGFANGYIVKQFQGTFLPEVAVKAFGWSLPVIEGVIGILLILGLFTKWSLVAGALTMTSLVFGMSLIQKWAVVGSQMVYAICFFALLFTLAYNHLSLDRLLGRDGDEDAPAPAA